jgi:hypothetical protein
MSATAEPDSKVAFRVPDADGSIQVETLWATALGNDEYKLDNSPFYAYSVSWEDLVYAPIDQIDGRPTFARVVKKSGNRTVRVILVPPAESGNTSDLVLQGLNDLGCSYEGANRAYVAVNVPADVELTQVRDYLVAKAVQWEYADPTYEELFGDDA